MGVIMGKSRRLNYAEMLALIFAGTTIVIVVILLGYNPARSLFWHLRHGNEVSFDQAKVILPIFWWREAHSDDDGISIRHAVFAASSLENLRIAPLTPERTKANNEAALAWRQEMLDSATSKGRSRFSPIDIQARGVMIYCVKDSSANNNNFLICRIPSMKWGIWFNGPAREEAEAEGLIGSLQISK